MCVCVCVCVCVRPTLATESCDTESFLSCLNSECSFSKNDCHTKVKEPSLPYYLPISKRRIYFPRLFVLSKNLQQPRPGFELVSPSPFPTLCHGYLSLYLCLSRSLSPGHALSLSLSLFVCVCVCECVHECMCMWGLSVCMSVCVCVCVCKKIYIQEDW